MASVAGSGIRLTPGSGTQDGEKSGSGIRDKHPESYFLELRNNHLCYKYLNSFMVSGSGSFLYPGSGDPGWKNWDLGSGINNPDPQHW